MGGMHQEILKHTFKKIVGKRVITIEIRKYFKMNNENI